MIEWQVDLAKRYGLYGSCHYQYWFDGRQLLEAPTNMMLDSKDIQIPFCLARANETWSRHWDGRDHHILVKQTHTPDKKLWRRHFEYLFRAWSDERAITADGKPMSVVYRPQRIQEIREMFEFWREEAVKRGLKGLHLVSLKQYEYPQIETLDHFDAVIQFQPFEAVYTPDFPVKVVAQRKWVQRLRILPEKVQDLLRRSSTRCAMRIRFTTTTWCGAIC